MNTPFHTTVSAAEQIAAIMESFDFARVRQTMIALNWEWSGEGIPSVAALKKAALADLESLGDRNGGDTYGVSSGGLHAFIDRWGWYNLTFEIADTSASEHFDR